MLFYLKFYLHEIFDWHGWTDACWSWCSLNWCYIWEIALYEVESDLN